MLHGLIGLGLVGLAASSQNHRRAAIDLVDILQGQVAAIDAMVRRRDCQEAYIFLRQALVTKGRLRIHRDHAGGIPTGHGQAMNGVLHDLSVVTDDFGRHCLGR